MIYAMEGIFISVIGGLLALLISLVSYVFLNRVKQVDTKIDEHKAHNDERHREHYERQNKQDEINKSLNVLAEKIIIKQEYIEKDVDALKNK